MIENSSIQIRLADRHDAAEIAVLLKNLGLSSPDKVDQINEHWDRLWENNPYYYHFKEPVLYGWVMQDKKKIVGFFGCIPRLYCLNSKLIPVAIASQWGVVKEYRGYTNMLCEKFFNENPIELKLVTTAIKPTGRIFEKFRGHKAPVPELGIVYMIPINLGRLIAHRYGTTSLGNVFKFLSNVIPWKFQFSILRKNGQISEVSSLNLPNDIDVFFERNLKKIQGLVAYRNSDILKWFYSPGNRGIAKRIFVYRVNNTTMGFASLLKEPVKDNPELKRYKLVDLIADDAQLKKEILKELIRISAMENADVFEIHHPNTIRRHDIPALIIKRSYSQFPVFYQTTDNSLTVLLQDKKNWNVSLFDGDTSL